VSVHRRQDWLGPNQRVTVARSARERKPGPPPQCTAAASVETRVVAVVDVVVVVGGAVELVQAASSSIRTTAATRPNRRTAHSYTTRAWHLVRRVEDNFWPRLDVSPPKRIVTV
jgi:hypothetical protein